MLKRKTIIRIGLISATICCLMMNHHKHKIIKQKYQAYANEEFDKGLKIRKFVFHQNFIKPIYDIKNQKKLEKIFKEEQVRKEKEKQREEDQWINLICSFYTGAEDENGVGNSGITASGKRLSRGICASNAHKFGTKIYTQRFGILEVQDTGNSNYIHQVNDNTYRIDVYVPNKTTANKLGIVKIKGKMIK